MLCTYPCSCTYPHLLAFIWKSDRKLHPASAQNLQQAGPAACPAILPCSSLWCSIEAPASISSNCCTLPGAAQTWHCCKLLIATDRQADRQTGFCSPLSCWPCPANCSPTPTKSPEKNTAARYLCPHGAALLSILSTSGPSPPLISETAQLGSEEQSSEQQCFNRTAQS